MIEADRRRSNFKGIENLSCFNVFILATGFESSLYPLCNDTPKCLVKIANKPILAYQLEFLERNKINEVNIITNKKYYQQISDYLNDQYIGNIKFELISDKDKNLSLDLFQIIKPRITMKNFMILSGDSILDFNISEFFDNHILQNSALSLILSKEDQKFLNQRLPYINNEIDINIYGLQNIPSVKDNYRNIVYKSKIYQDLNKGKFCDKGGEKVKISKRLLNYAGNFDLLYNFDDIHVYLFDKQIFSILEDVKVKESNPMITDFVSYLINNFYSPRLRNLYFERNNTVNEEHNNNLTEENLSNNIKKKLPKIKILGLIIDKQNYVYRVTNVNKLLNSLSEFQKNIEDIPKIYFYTQNNLKNVFQEHSDEISRNINNDRPYFEGLDIIEPITLDSLVAHPIAAIIKKSKVVKSVIGLNLNLGGNSKVTYSMVTNNVKIGANCVITNCIISDNVTIEDKCVLSDCIILRDSVVTTKTELSNCNIPEEEKELF